MVNPFKAGLQRFVQHMHTPQRSTPDNPPPANPEPSPVASPNARERMARMAAVAGAATQAEDPPAQPAQADSAGQPRPAERRPMPGRNATRGPHPGDRDHSPSNRALAGADLHGTGLGPEVGEFHGLLQQAGRARTPAEFAAVTSDAIQPGRLTAAQRREVGLTLFDTAARHIPADRVADRIKIAHGLAMTTGPFSSAESPTDHDKGYASTLIRSLLRQLSVIAHGGLRDMKDPGKDLLDAFGRTCAAALEQGATRIDAQALDGACRALLGVDAHAAQCCQEELVRREGDAAKVALSHLNAAQVAKLAAAPTVAPVVDLHALRHPVSLDAFSQAVAGASKHCRNSDAYASAVEAMVGGLINLNGADQYAGAQQVLRMMSRPPTPWHPLDKAVVGQASLDLMRGIPDLCNHLRATGIPLPANTAARLFCTAAATHLRTHAPNEIPLERVADTIRHADAALRQEVANQLRAGHELLPLERMRHQGSFATLAQAIEPLAASAQH